MANVVCTAVPIQWEINMFTNTADLSVREYDIVLVGDDF